ncbi:hypothetical protein AGLY_004614 [Aphis glycines]|uniref:Uncharacterized protein n=1 Tax=Aphis glycines TaxID=307491 RepID=A0A6G0TUG4_APHGL|nr:hypothetical protein AGLY_004614 [Aphis glycines]
MVTKIKHQIKKLADDIKFILFLTAIIAFSVQQSYYYEENSKPSYKYKNTDNTNLEQRNKLISNILKRNKDLHTYTNKQNRKQKNHPNANRSNPQENKLANELSSLHATAVTIQLNSSYISSCSGYSVNSLSSHIIQHNLSIVMRNSNNTIRSNSKSIYTRFSSDSNRSSDPDTNLSSPPSPADVKIAQVTVLLTNNGDKNS